MRLVTVLHIVLISVMMSPLYTMNVNFTDQSIWNETHLSGTGNQSQDLLKNVIFNITADSDIDKELTNRLISNQYSIDSNFSSDVIVNHSKTSNITNIPTITAIRDPVCTHQVCSNYPARRFHWKNGDDKSFFDILFSDQKYSEKLLDMAPCPPYWNLALVCTLENNLTCNEKTHILNNCLKHYQSKSYCGDLLTCSGHLRCEKFGQLLNSFKQCSVKFMPLLPTPTMMTKSGGYRVSSSNTSSDVPPDNSAVDGPISIVLIVVILFGFLFVPFIVYLLLNRDYRRGFASCCRHTFCRKCNCKRRQTQPTPIEATEIEPIATVASVTSKEADDTTNSISRDLSNDSGIGLFMDYDFIDEDVPSEYQV